MTKPAIFVYGPRASGKTYNAKRIADIFGIEWGDIVDEFDVTRHSWQRGRLYLTNNFAHELPRGDAIRIPISAFAFGSPSYTDTNSILRDLVWKKAEPEWGEPIPTPGDSCPEWLTLDLIHGNQYQHESGRWNDVSAIHNHPVEKWVWDAIPAVRFPVGHPIYAQRQLEAAGYTVTPPAPPEPDYEAYREKLTTYLKGKRSDRTINDGDRLSGPLTPDDREMIRGLIVVGVKP